MSKKDFEGLFTDTKYKLVKWYPSLPEDWEEGMEVYNSNINEYSPTRNTYMKHSLHCLEVEDNPEYWKPLKSDIDAVKEILDKHIHFKNSSSLHEVADKIVQALK